MKFNLPLLTELEKAAQQGIRKGLGAVLERSNELAPEDEGALIDSGEVRLDDLTGQIAYREKYSGWQHDNLDYQHPDGGEAKFLETAAQEIDVAEFVAYEVRAALDG